MKVSDLQQHELFTAQADESLEVAADRMSWHQVRRPSGPGGSAPRSLLIGRGSVVAVDLAGRIDPMVRAGGRERADCRAHEPATACL